MHKIRNISKSFYLNRLFSIKQQKPKKIEALNSINFDFRSGEITGITGDNGSGKSTLLKIIGNLLEPDSGEIYIDNLTTEISYISGNERSFFWRLSVYENLLFFGRMYGFNDKFLKLKILESLNILGISKYLNQPFMSLSSGTKKKISIARALLKNPKIYLFDEITNSLDRNSVDDLLKIVKTLINEDKNVSILWATHRTDEIDAIADTVLNLREGNVREVYKNRSVIQ